jgi:hypothetical protein
MLYIKLFMNFFLCNNRYVANPEFRMICRERYTQTHINYLYLVLNTLYFDNSSLKNTLGNTAGNFRNKNFVYTSS